jgi:hypothetical protein
MVVKLFFFLINFVTKKWQFWYILQIKVKKGTLAFADCKRSEQRMKKRLLSVKSLMLLLSPALHNANNLSNNTFEDAFGIELRPYCCKSFEMLQRMPLAESHVGVQNHLLQNPNS